MSFLNEFVNSFSTSKNVYDEYLKRFSETKESTVVSQEVVKVIQLSPEEKERKAIAAQQTEISLMKAQAEAFNNKSLYSKIKGKSLTA